MPKSLKIKIKELSSRLDAIRAADNILFKKLKTKPYKALFMSGHIPSIFIKEYDENWLETFQIQGTLLKIDDAVFTAQKIIGKKKVNDKNLSKFFGLPE